MSMFNSGIRPYIDSCLAKEDKRDYRCWSASSAGYCYRKLIFERLKIPHVNDDPRTRRVFAVGHIFHAWVQEITKDISRAQELELTDKSLDLKGHIDDLVNINDRLILYDYKTVNSRAFSYSKDMSYFHKMQLGTYLLLLRRNKLLVEESRILRISKDDLRMDEQQLMWSPELDSEVLSYWNGLNDYWKHKTLPECTCDAHENGFMAKDKYNPYFYNGEPCSVEYFKKHDGFDLFK